MFLGERRISFGAAPRRDNLPLHMAEKVREIQTRLLRRRCVSCGYDGTLLRNGVAECCPRCACDLLARPPRSYAEMEGLIGQPIRVQPGQPPVVRRDSRQIERWLLFAFLSIIFMISIAGLTIELTRDLQ